MLRSSVLLFLLVLCLLFAKCKMRPSYDPPMARQSSSVMMEPRPVVGPMMKGQFPRRDPLRGMLIGALIGSLIGVIADWSTMMGAASRPGNSILIDDNQYFIIDNSTATVAFR
ncbi:hypothetical protein GCK32_021111 [Trichostrongylus colubriformis]|uniref:Uncharacterized protein n=1 Tax=Trichostrongylus colubriformis TaxID=6319 RepID=A0AAN8G5A2_TRICO